ncbi:MAG: ATP-grasp domain-containing protein, partial [Patescibacteria group bacterium]
FVKPRYGSGSKGIGVVKQTEDVAYFLNSGIEYVAQELLRGQHYSVDVLVHQKKFITAVPRADIRVKGSEPITVRIEKNEIIMECAKQVTERLGIKSTFNLEGFLNGSAFFINEINVRFGSGIIFSYLAGANFPAYLLGIETAMAFREGVFTTISRGFELK